MIEAKKIGGCFAGSCHPISWIVSIHGRSMLRRCDSRKAAISYGRKIISRLEALREIAALRVEGK